MTDRKRKYRWLAVVAILALGLIPPVSSVVDEPFYVHLFTRIMIFAIAALSLDLILGYGGMLSFGHAVYLGLGAYSVGILASHGINNGLVHLSVAVVVSALSALLLGLVCLRTSGGYFIMITLAFAQMIYFLGVSLRPYGGDEGLTIRAHSDFGGLLNLDDPDTLFYFVFSVLLIFLWVSFRLVASRFGMVIRGANYNERRMIALGYPTFRYKLTAFTIAGAMCGFAGALIANLTLFISPVLMHWTRSGELMMITILGGSGTLIGPLFGTVAYLLLEDLLSSVTEHWQLFFGPILVLAVLFAKGGIFGLAGVRRSA